MKTRNYKTVPVGSRCRNNQGLGPYHRIELVGKPASEQEKITKRVNGTERRVIDKASRTADRVRRQAEKGLDWDAVRELIDEGLTLEQAKKEATW